MRSLRRLLGRLAESDEERLAAETRAWADTIEGSVRIVEAPRRQRVRIAGVIRRLTVLPLEDSEALEVVVWDGTGDVRVRFMGRRSIQGLTLGTRVVVEGVLGEQRGVPTMLNPVLEFSAA
ncbi:MAG: hypothetical protein KatS3mg013_1695 [Actinomycetota bacterium]|nr:MAG: hypothetical protein KatS3mg013_1695 [Actinomycetota bacterium]